MVNHVDQLRRTWRVSRPQDLKPLKDGERTRTISFSPKKHIDPISEKELKSSGDGEEEILLTDEQ